LDYTDKYTKALEKIDNAYTEFEPSEKLSLGPTRKPPMSIIQK